MFFLLQSISDGYSIDVIEGRRFVTCTTAIDESSDLGGVSRHESSDPGPRRQQANDPWTGEPAFVGLGLGGASPAVGGCTSSASSAPDVSVHLLVGHMCRHRQRDDALPVRGGMLMLGTR
jgi:hypothetical protein